MVLDRTLVLRQRILQVLREADEPLATMEVVKRVGKIEHRESPRPIYDPHDHSHLPWMDTWEVIERPAVTGEWVYLRPALHHDVYPHLRALAKQGHCFQLPREAANRTTHWTLIRPA